MTPHRTVRALVIVAALAVVLKASAGWAQEARPASPAEQSKSAPQPAAAPKPAPAPAPAPARVPPPEQVQLQVQVVLARYQGEKRISSAPYVLSVNAGPAGGRGYGPNSQLRMGARVPIPALQATSPETKVFTTVSPVNYEEIGTNIDCRARIVGDGTFDLSVSIEDKSVYAASGDAVPAAAQGPVIRTYQSSNTLILRDGQTRQFTAATDRVNGETIRAEVTLTVIK